MRDFLLAVIALLLAGVLYVMYDDANVTPGEYREQTAMQEQEDFMKHWTDKAAAEVNRQADETLENTGK